MTDRPMEARMLGGVSLTAPGGAPLLPDLNLRSKAGVALVYLLYNHGRLVPRDELVRVLYGWEAEAADISANLRNIIFRLRGMLSRAGLPGGEIIVYRSGLYGWTESLPCEIDALRFEEAVRKADGATDEDARLGLLLEAVNLYGGAFLPGVTAEWAIVHGARLRGLYLSSINALCAIGRRHSRMAEALAACERALSLYPDEESLHAQRISMLFEQGRVLEARAAYSEMEDSLYANLGVGPSEEMLLLYRRMSQGHAELSVSMADICQTICEQGERRGAYACGLLPFIDTCRLLARASERAGQTAFLVLCTLSSRDGQPSAAEDVAQAAGALEEALRGSLRRGDMYARYSAAQYLALLNGISQENCSIVINRVMRAFQANAGRRDVSLSFKFSPLSDLTPDVSETSGWR